MKVSIYLDVLPYMTRPDMVMATTTPGDKLRGATRYRIDVDIPDPAQPDVTISAGVTPLTTTGENTKAQ